jgi:hypothetical protein
MWVFLAADSTIITKKCPRLMKTAIIAIHRGFLINVITKLLGDCIITSVVEWSNLRPGVESFVLMSKGIPLISQGLQGRALPDRPIVISSRNLIIS